MKRLESSPAPGGRPARRLRPHCTALTLAGACGLAMTVAVARAQQPLPSGMAAAHGQATAVVRGNQMTVTNSANAILNWQSFSVGNGNSVRFDQPSAGSQVLNRVVGNDPSSVLGSISSNGGVWLVNSNGVLFGPNARVDVAGFVASTLNITDADWRARRYNLFAAPGSDSAAVTNLGELRSTSGGRVMLFGGRGGVRNEGVLDAPGGQVGMAAGRYVELVDSNSPFVAVRVAVPEGGVSNLGRLFAAGGQVDLNAAMVNQHAVVSADGAAAVRGGSVHLQASGKLDLSSGSMTSANGSAGGSITVHGGATVVSGSVQAEGLRGAGGKIRLLGAQVGLMDGAGISASGRDGGGEVLVGGGQQGLDPRVPNAKATFLAPAATISADATQAGNGGRIIVWSDDATRAYGRLSARGGVAGGDGGFIETSGGWLDARPSGLALDAPRGRSGTWLLDPYNITIVNRLPDVDLATVPSPPTVPPTIAYGPAAPQSEISVQTINTALLTGNVTITTLGTPGSGAGNISMTRNQGPLVISADQPNTLEFIASDTISVKGAEIRSQPVGGGPGLNVKLSAPQFVEISNSTIATTGQIEVVSQSFAMSGGPALLAGGSVKVNADFIDMNLTSTISASQAIGTTISMAGSSGQTIKRLRVEPGAALQVAPAAAWEIFVPSIEPSPSFNLGTLVPDRYVYLRPSVAPLAVGRTVFYTDGQPPAGDSVLPPDLTFRDLGGRRPDDPSASVDLGGETIPTFGPIDVSGLPAETLAKLLDGRDKYKAALLAPVRDALSKDASLAEVGRCDSPLKGMVGDCLITDDEREILRAYLRMSNEASKEPFVVPDPTDLPACTTPLQTQSGNCMPINLNVEALKSFLPRQRNQTAVGTINGIEQKYALVIGIGKHDEPRIPSLPNAVTDATNVATTLRDTFGYDVRLLKDEGATKSAIVQELVVLAVAARKKDSVLVYFAGHGTVVSASSNPKDPIGDGYWLPSDMSLQKPQTLLANSDITKLLALVEAKQILLVSDSCFAGKFVNSKSDWITARPVPDPGEVLTKRSITVMTAGRDEPVFDSGAKGHSVFTSSLLEALKSTPTWRPGGAVHSVVAPAVSAKTERLQIPKYAGLSKLGHDKGGEYLFEVRKPRQP